MNYRRSRQSKRSNRSNRSNRNRSRRNRRGGGFQSDEVIEAFNEWARQNDRSERAIAGRPEGDMLIINGKKKESDGVNNVMLGAYNIRSDTIEILQPDITLPNTVLTKAQISDLLKVAVLKP
jgi:hypothetical protein